jgi:predicted metalloendopeptidase
MSTDPHSSEDVRVNGAAKNFEEFGEAFYRAIETERP